MHYYCKDCGHYYGYRPQGLSAGIIALHRTVSHGGRTPIVAVPYVHTGFEAGAL